jgi:predicted nucleic acid-binding protein
MTVIADTGVLYADHDRDAIRHEADTAGGFAHDGPAVRLLPR